MDTFDAIYQRRSVKHYQSDAVMPAEDRQKLMEAIRQAPTSFNIQNYRIVLVDDPGIRQQIRAAAWNQEQIETASLVAVICADLKAWEKNPARYWETAPAETQQFLANAILDFYKDRQWQQRDEAMRSAGIVAQTLMLGAKALGYDSCPMIGMDAEAVGKIISLPQDHVMCMVVVVGKAETPARPKGGYIPDEEVFIENQF